jgi:hypothetical protein
MTSSIESQQKVLGRRCFYKEETHGVGEDGGLILLPSSTLHE